MPREVHIGTPHGGGITVGGMRVPVIAGVAGGGDAGRVDLGAGVEQSGAGLAAIRARVAHPLLVEVRDETQCAAAIPYADGVVMRLPLLEAIGPPLAAVERGTPLIVRREPGTSLQGWLAAADACSRAGARQVALCEGGGSPGEGGTELGWAPRLDLLARARERTDMPVLVDVGAAPELVAAAVAAGADGIVLGTEASAAEAADAAARATSLAAFGRAAAPDRLDEAREAIDQVDACLAELLERRARLAGYVQRLKPVGGFAGRDPERERELVAAMARRAPRLGLARLHRIMAVVIEAGLDLAESDSPADGSDEEATDPGEPGGRSATHRGVAGRNVPRAS